jgi:hypothetical protein
MTKSTTINMTKSINNKDNYLIYIITVILIILVFFKLYYEHNEGFENNNNNNNNNSNSNSNKQYIKFNETVFDNEKKNELITWKNKTLSQCKFDCEEDNTCIGFSRDKIDDEKSGNCYPKTTIGDCHTLRKGDPTQRNYAQKFDSYLKSNQNINNLYNRCIGDAKLTLNKKIYLGLYSKPDNYISILNNQVRIVEYKNKNTEFYKNTIFEIVTGLEGSGTVSFIIIDNFQEDYYLSADIANNIIQLIPIDISDSSVIERSNASFELLNGFADSRNVSIRTYSNIGEHFFLLPEGMENRNKIKSIKNPQLMLVREKNINTRLKKESATFHILDKDIKPSETFKSKPFINHNNQNIINKHNTKEHRLLFDKNNTKEQFNSNNQSTQRNIRRFPKELKEKHFGEHFKSKDQSNLKLDTNYNSIILVDAAGNKLMIPSYFNNINENKLVSLVSKLNAIYDKELKDTGNPSRKFDLDNVNTVLITNPEEFSCRIYDYDFFKDGMFGNRISLYEYENEINNIDMNLKQENEYSMGELIFMAQKLKIDTSNKSKNELYKSIITLTAYKDNIKLVDDDTKKEINYLDEEISDTQLIYLINEINKKNYFKIKAIQIFKHNPKTKFDKKTKNYNKVNYISDKLKHLEKTHVNDTQTMVFAKFNKNKEQELKAYKDEVLKKEFMLDTKKKQLDENIRSLNLLSSNYKLDKFSKDNLLMTEGNVLN